jgi:N-acetylglutamate synthase-like GNAT family acetyltransferase
MSLSEPTLRAARRSDLEAVVAIVREAGLPTAGLMDAFPGGYVVVSSGSGIIATAGLEVHDRVGLLRSLAVVPTQRGAGLGRLVVEDRLRAAREQHLDAVYLLTTTAADYFRRLGFEDTSRSAVPNALRSASEFATICPASALCLSKIFATLRPLPARPRLHLQERHDNDDSDDG